eukprot:5566241-Alexandrium_andersonii.AAC.2
MPGALRCACDSCSGMLCGPRMPGACSELWCGWPVLRSPDAGCVDSARGSATSALRGPWTLGAGSVLVAGRAQLSQHYRGARAPAFVTVHRKY